MLMWIWSWTLFFWHLQKCNKIMSKVHSDWAFNHTVYCPQRIELVQVSSIKVKWLYLLPPVFCWNKLDVIEISEKRVSRPWRLEFCGNTFLQCFQRVHTVRKSHFCQVTYRLSSKTQILCQPGSIIPLFVISTTIYCLQHVLIPSA